MFIAFEIIILHIVTYLLCNNAIRQTELLVEYNKNQPNYWHRVEIAVPYTFQVSGTLCRYLHH